MNRLRNISVHKCGYILGLLHWYNGMYNGRTFKGTRTLPRDILSPVFYPIIQSQTTRRDFLNPCVNNRFLPGSVCRLKLWLLVKVLSLSQIVYFWVKMLFFSKNTDLNSSEKSHCWGQTSEERINLRAPPSSALLFIGRVHIGAMALHVLHLIWFGYIARLSQWGGGG